MIHLKRHVKQVFAASFYRSNGRYCPVCQRSSKKFWKAGLVPREDSKCMYCGSLERHRLTWLYFERMTDLFNGSPKQMLHVAPEPAFGKLFSKKLSSGYITADLYDPNVMVKMD